MSEENKPNEENQEEQIDQEEMAKQWEEALQQQEGQTESTESQTEEPQETEEEVDQEEIAKQWEEALQEQQSKQEETVDQDEIAKQWEEALQEQKEETKSGKVEDEKLELLMDIPLEISVEVGGKEILLEDVLKLNPNAVLELDKYINEPVDIKINGKLVAKGELYTVENNFGVKITSIVTVQERMKLLLEGGK